MRLMEAGRYGNDAMRAYAFVDDCIARGKSVYEGGERYTFIEPIFIGFGNTVDSICAIDILVRQEKIFTLPELSATSSFASEATATISPGSQSPSKTRSSRGRNIKRRMTENLIFRVFSVILHY